MKYHIMTDGYLIAVVPDPDVDYYRSIEWTKVGIPFTDYRHANEHADKLALALGVLA